MTDRSLAGSLRATHGIIAVGAFPVVAITDSARTRRPDGFAAVLEDGIVPGRKYYPQA